MVVWAQAANGGQDDNPALFKVERGPGRYHAGAQRGVDENNRTRSGTGDRSWAGLRGRCESLTSGHARCLVRIRWPHAGQHGELLSYATLTQEVAVDAPLAVDTPLPVPVVQISSPTPIKSLICAYFWPCEEALRIAMCESTMGQNPDAYADWNPSVHRPIGR